MSTTKAIILAGLISSTATASEIKIGVPLQTGGLMGFAATGVSAELGNYGADVLYGYTPEPIGGEDLRSIAFKNSYLLDSVPAYFGVAALWSLDQDAYVVLPSKYPRGYYPPTGLRFAPYIGGRFDFDNQTIYAEVVTLDWYIENKANNPNFVEWKEILTLGFGYKYWINSGD